MKFLQGKWIQVAVLACCGLPGLATAGTISSTGVFETDDQMWQLTFTLSSASTVTIQSWAYGGGTNGAGTVIPQGGFATNIALFDTLGLQNLIDQDSAAGGCGPRNINSSTGNCLDGFFSTTILAAGDYLLVLTEAGNPAFGPTFADGFAETGAGDFTGGPFFDPFFNQMNGNWAVDVSADGLVVGSDAPEPATALMGLLIVPALAIVARRRRHS
jgi:hypothetical protein